MITRLWSLTLLVTQLVLGFDHSIDLARCKTETACFIRESCFVDKSDPTTFPESPKTLVKYEVEKDLKGGDCDVVIQIKELNDNKIHVMMHIKNSEKLKKEEGLKLEQKDTMFHCTQGAVSGKQGITLALKGTDIFHDDEIFCSFTALSSDRWKDMNRYVVEFPTLSYVKGGSKVEIKYAEIGREMWQDIKYSFCDHDLFESSSKEGDAGVQLTEVDTTLSTTTCDGGKVIVEQDSKMEASSVTCEGFKWMAKGVPGGDKELSIIPPGISKKFQVYCPKLRCRMCTTAPPPLSSCTGCTAPAFNAPTDPTTCPKRTCPNNKWTITGKEIIVGEAECKHKGGDDMTKFGWFVNGVELTEAACMEKIDCGAKFNDLCRYPTVLADCPGDTCKIKGLGTNHISCVDGGDRLRLMPGGYSFAEIECDFSTGRYMEMGKQPGNGLNFTSIECIPVRFERRKFGSGRRPDPSN